MFLYEITFWSRTANCEKYTANENSGLTTIGVSNNLCEVGTQGFDGIDAKNINCPNELCNITRMLDCNSEKKRKKPWRLILSAKDALKSYLIGQGGFDILSYWSRTLWRLILLIMGALTSTLLFPDALTSTLLFSDALTSTLLFSDALESYLIAQRRYEVWSYWSRTLWSRILLIKVALPSYLIGQGRFDVFSYCSWTLWSLILLIKDAFTSYLIAQRRYEVWSYWSRTLWSLILLFSDTLKSYLIDQGRFDVLSYW